MLETMTPGQQSPFVEQLRALDERAVIGNVAPRRAIAVGGTDRATYLQGLLTNDVKSLLGRGILVA
jgi:folate-binding Fe-S cluster repair protein YgfZ